MKVMLLLIAISVCLGLIGVVAFIWAVRTGQFEDPQGDAERILLDDDGPGPNR